jgi:hypothetical protein
MEVHPHPPFFLRHGRTLSIAIAARRRLPQNQLIHEDNKPARARNTTGGELNAVTR